MYVDFMAFEDPRHENRQLQQVNTDYTFWPRQNSRKDGRETGSKDLSMGSRGDHE